MSASGGDKKRSPHIGTYSGPFIDFNGVGKWSVAAMRQRYLKYAADFGIKSPAHLVPRQHAEDGRTWLYPLIEEVIGRIEAGDAAAIEIGTEFIEEDDFFVFGKILKSNTARALRRAMLTDAQQQRVRRRIVSMMLAGNVPHEFREYKRLLLKVGVGELWAELDAGVDRSNAYVMRYYDYLKRFAPG